MILDWGTETVAGRGEVDLGLVAIVIVAPGCPEYGLIGRNDRAIVNLGGDCLNLQFSRLV
jgi:hypothetical protein